MTKSKGGGVLYDIIITFCEAFLTALKHLGWQLLGLILPGRLGFYDKAYGHSVFNVYIPVASTSHRKLNILSLSRHGDFGITESVSLLTLSVDFSIRYSGPSWD